MTTTEARVGEGAKWLDRHKPGWLGQINLNRLDLATCGECVLGQTFGDYVRIAFATGPHLGTYTDDFGWSGATRMPFSKAWAVSHGFALSWPYGRPKFNAYEKRRWNTLREAWVTEILSRRFAEQAAPVETPAAVTAK